MSKSIENTSLKKIPTSQLIFYQRVGVLDKETRRSLDSVLYRRLFHYGMPVDDARDFLRREESIVSFRGDNLENYVFGSNKSFHDTLKPFYESINQLGRACIIKENFNTLMFSELVEYYSYFNRFAQLYGKRVKSFKNDVRSQENIEGIILASDTISDDEKIECFKGMKILKEKALQRQVNEESLKQYNEFVSKCILSKIREVTGFDKTGTLKEEVKMNLLVLKESLLLLGKEKNVIQLEELKKYADILFDAYQYDTEFINQYNVFGYSFSKKR